MERDGQNVRSMDDEELIRAAMTGTGAFPGILSNVAHKSMAQSYQTAPTTFQLWTARGSNTDFKDATRYRLSEADELLPMTETGEFKHAEVTEASAKTSVATYGRTFTMTRKAIINDDMGALSRIPALYGQAARRGINKMVLKQLTGEGRVMDVVSRGGSFITGWMLHNEKENPFYEYFDDILDICEKYDVTISLGDGLRPGCLADATDRAQIQELINIGELTQRAWDRGVQVMCEGPGHVPFNQIETNMKLQKSLCHGAPFYVLGPLVTDVAPGYDHITSAIGGTLAAVSGADFLCYVTPAEHLGLPDLDDVREGVIAARIAAHAADLAKGNKQAWEWDVKMARARKALDWKAQLDLAIDPDKAKEFRKSKNKEEEEACSMCGDYCAVKIVNEYLTEQRKKAWKA